ncbi:MAG: hypothetical protein ACRCU2_28370 [Planktothrix sp.]
MSIGEIIGTLTLLITLFQAMMAWMSNEGIRLSLFSGDWIRLLMILMASALIVGGLLEASYESLLVFFIGNFLIIEVMSFVAHRLPRKKAYLGLPVLVVIYGLIACVSVVPVMSNLCITSDFLDLIIRANKCLKETFGALEIIMLMICIFLSLLGLNLPLKTNNWAILRLMNWLACGIGVCLGYGFRIIFL